MRCCVSVVSCIHVNRNTCCGSGASVVWHTPAARQSVAQHSSPRLLSNCSARTPPCVNLSFSLVNLSRGAVRPQVDPPCSRVGCSLHNNNNPPRYTLCCHPQQGSASNAQHGGTAGVQRCTQLFSWSPAHLHSRTLAGAGKRLPHLHGRHFPSVLATVVEVR